jgi:AcrR family transcriptional regulator
MQMIVDSGFDGLTMPGLAERADVAVGGLYRYFASKQDLLAALQVHSITQLGEWIDEHRSAAGLDGLRETAQAVHSFGREHSTSFALLELAVSDPRRILDDEQAMRVQEAILPILLGVAQRFHEAEEAGQVSAGHAMRRTMALWGVVFGCLHFRKRDGRISDTELHSGRVLDEAVEALLRGWA